MFYIDFHGVALFRHSPIRHHANMARPKDLDEWIDGHLQFLKEVYFETDPEQGEESELAKHELAQLAVEKLWYMQGKLLGWAQAHLTGYSILSENPELVSFLEERLGYPLHEDSHALEQLGLVYNLNPPDRDDPALQRMEVLLEEYNALHPGDDEVILTASAMRRTIRELLMSRCADNSYWRHDLQDSLAALNDGEIDGLATPSPGKRQGLPYSLNRWKLEALRQVRYRIGWGMKKYRALEEVGQGIGQSPETLRDWEKELERSHDRAVDLFCSELAGRFRAHFKGENEMVSPDGDEYDSHRGVNHLDQARYLLPTIESRTFEEIKAKIFQYRQKKTDG